MGFVLLRGHTDLAIAVRWCHIEHQRNGCRRSGPRWREDFAYHALAPPGAGISGRVLQPTMPMQPVPPRARRNAAPSRSEALADRDDPLRQ